MTKGKVFIVSCFIILLIFLSMFVLAIVKHAPEHIPVSACLIAVETLAGLYFTGSVVNNGVKGHFWNQQMHDSENKTTAGRKNARK